MWFPVSRPLDMTNNEMNALIQSAEAVLANSDLYPKKYRGLNFFTKLSVELKEQVSNIVQRLSDADGLIWHFEVFYAVEAVGMHNDRNFFPKLDERCDKGLIIPLKWQGLTPKTKYFDLFYEEKVNWTGKAFKTLDGEYRPHNQESLDKGAVEMTWQKNQIIFFDSRQIHEASPFVTGPDDFKLSINGLGYSRYL